jgi:nicotinamide riboside transporter PnuC
MDKLAAEKALEEQKEQAEHEARWQRRKNRVAFIGSCVVLLTALVTFYFSLRGDTSTTEVRHLDSVGSALSDFR